MKNKHMWFGIAWVMILIVLFIFKTRTAIFLLPIVGFGWVGYMIYLTMLGFDHKNNNEKETKTKES